MQLNFLMFSDCDRAVHMFATEVFVMLVTKIMHNFQRELVA